MAGGVLSDPVPGKPALFEFQLRVALERKFFVYR